MSDKAKPEFSLDQFSEAETDEEFGLPEFKEHFADTLTPAVLRDWTAKDFASIYVRFRPHLERHARRFLVNPSEVEEVVQDAFLYLMTSLPELDSELGVLKFLKWKTRLLCLDMLRSRARTTTFVLDEQHELDDGSEDLSLGLERADNSAIVALALSKLQPRHRDALVAALYEEKPIHEVASQMGLSDNAFRQLLHRARGAFKESLASEAEKRGMTISEIISLTGRKVRKAGAVTLVLLVTLGLPLLPQLSPTLDTGARQEPVVQPIPNLSQDTGQRNEMGNLLIPSSSDTSALGVVENLTETNEQGVTVVSFGPKLNAEDVRSEEASGALSEVTQNQESMAEDDVRAAAYGWASKLLSDLSLTDSEEPRFSANLVSIEIGSSAVISLALSSEMETIVSSAVLHGIGDASGLVAIPTGLSVNSTSLESGASEMRIVMTGFAVGDLSGQRGNRVVEDAHFNEIAVEVELFFSDLFGKRLESAKAKFLPRS